MKQRDLEATGLVRYFPTFKTMFDCICETISRKVAAREDRTEIHNLLKAGQMDSAAGLVLSDPSKSEYLGNFLFDRDRNNSIIACWSLRKASQLGANISPAVPMLLRSLAQKDYYMRVSSANTLCSAVESMPGQGRMGVLSGVESFVSRELDSAVIADPRAAPILVESLLKLVRTIRELEGVYPLSEIRLERELKAHPKQIADHSVGE